MMQTAFGLANSFGQLDAGGDPLRNSRNWVDWRRFRPELEAVRDKERKSTPEKPFDVVLMLGYLCFNRCTTFGRKIEFQIRDRISFMRFLDLSLGDACG